MFISLQGMSIHRKLSAFVAPSPLSAQFTGTRLHHRNARRVVCSESPPSLSSPPHGDVSFTTSFEKTAAPNLSLRVQIRTWAPGPSSSFQSPTCGLLILHGTGWHSGWFANLGEALASRTGCKVVGLDFLGHGESDSIDGLRSFARNMDDHLEDARAGIARLRLEIANKPLFILGESGGAIECAMLMLEKRGVEDIAGWILCGPALRPAPGILPPPPIIAVIRLLSTIFPRAVLPVHGISGETFDAAFGSKAQADLARADPLTDTDDMTVRLAWAVASINCLERIAKESDKIHISNLLILHNEKDVRVEYEASQDFIEKVVCEGTKELFNPGGKGHQLFQETPAVSKKSIDKVVEFIKSVLSTT